MERFGYNEERMHRDVVNKGLQMPYGVVFHTD